MTDALLLVAVRTDQPEIASRVGVILAAARPVKPKGDPVVFAKPVAELTAADVDALTRFFHPDDVDRLNLGPVAGSGS